jgi:hypothetical protein
MALDPNVMIWKKEYEKVVSFEVHKFSFLSNERSILCANISIVKILAKIIDVKITAILKFSRNPRSQNYRLPFCC